MHLGKLVRSLRLLGFDMLYPAEADDAELIGISARDRRIVLTRDLGLIKHKRLTRGYRLRSAGTAAAGQGGYPCIRPGERSAAIYAMHEL
jgi:uncharacterized protein with PIN domain